MIETYPRCYGDGVITTPRLVGCPHITLQVRRDLEKVSLFAKTLALQSFTSFTLITGSSLDALHIATIELYLLLQRFMLLVEGELRPRPR